MPINTDTEYLDGAFTISEPEPSTLQEVVDLIGEQAVREQAVSNLYYRNKYPRVYRKVSEAITAEFPRAVKETKILKDGTKKDVLVEPMVHLRQYLATGDEAKAKLAELFGTIGPAEPLFVKGERAGGGGKISQVAMDVANIKFAAGSDAVDKTIEVIETTVPGYKVSLDSDGNATAESLARGVQTLLKHNAQKALAESKALLG